MSTKIDKEKKENHVLVEVVTTSGTYPASGFDQTPVNQKVKIILKQAADELKIVTTDKWVATIGGRVIDPELTFAENNLSGEVSIDYGLSESGGGQ